MTPDLSHINFPNTNHWPADSQALRPLLLDVVRLLERVVARYQRSLLSADPSAVDDDLRGLAQFADWAGFSLARGRALLLGSEDADGTAYRYCPPHLPPEPTLAARLAARRASRAHTDPATRWRQRFH